MYKPLAKSQRLSTTTSTTVDSSSTLDFMYSSTVLLKHDIRKPSAYEKNIENKLSLEDIDYQSLMITERELQLQLISEKERKNTNKDTLKKLEAPDIKLKQKLVDDQLLLRKKRQYAANYHRHVVQRLSERAESKMAEILQIEQRLDRQYQALSNKLIDQHDSMAQAIKQKEEALTNYRATFKKIQQEIQKHRQEKQQRQKSNSIVRKQMMKKRREQEEANSAYYEMQNEMIRLQNDERYLTNQLTLLKELQNVEQQHIKTCMVLERAITIREQLKVRQEAYNRETSREYENNIMPQLKVMTKEKNKENDGLEKKISEKNKQMNELTEKIKKRYDEMRNYESPRRKQTHY